MNQNDLPYNSLSDFLKQKFGGKVRKVSLDAGFSCPNRYGSERKGGCFWCDPYGSGPIGQNKDWFQTLLEEKDKILKNNCVGIIAYFQGYSNTYSDLDTLKNCYEKALSVENVLGIAIGTRPDCLNSEILDYLYNLNRSHFLWVEIGMQTMHNSTLKLCNRRHLHEDTIEAVEQLQKRGILTVLHLIAGLPYESEEMIVDNFKECARLHPWGVKLHPLHIVKGSVFEKWYEENKIELLTMEQYCDLAAKFITILPDDTIIHRITGERPEGMLIAPKWCLNKNQVRNEIIKKVNKLKKKK